MEEVWEDVPGFEGIYRVSNIGRVCSVDRILRSGKPRKGKILRCADDGHGYIRITLTKNNESHKFMVHRLVAMAFIENPNKYPMVNHKDEDKSNNIVSNLEWCDCKYNINYGNRTRKASGENTKNSKLNNEAVLFIRTHYKPKDKTYGRKALAKKFNVNGSAIDRVIEHKTWKFI